MHKIRMVVAALFAGCGILLAAAEPKAGDVLPREAWNFVPSIADRAYWTRADAEIPALREIVKEAGPLVRAKYEIPSREYYLDFSTNGSRTRYEAAYRKLWLPFGKLVLAACVTGEQPYVDKCAEIMRLYCDMPTWILPAHDVDNRNLNGRQVDIDLISSMIGWDLAIAVNLLRPRLRPELVELVEKRLVERIVEPFTAMVDKKRSPHWLYSKNNWSIVCHTGVAGTLLGLKMDPALRARLLTRSVELTNNFLAGFNTDGYCSEGMSYWGYGFGHYVMLAEMLHQASGGKLNLMLREAARLPAAYPAKIRLKGDVNPAFSDCEILARAPGVYLMLVDELTNRPSRRWADFKISPRANMREVLMLMKLPKCPPVAADAEVKGEEPFSEFPAAGVFVARPGGTPGGRLYAAFKGGSNFEYHNQNDVGSYILSVDGVLPQVVDPGAQRYTAKSFSKERYTFKVNNSYGHNVPVIDGKLQIEGEKTYATILAKQVTPDGVTLTIDMQPAYRHLPVIARLHRTFEYRRAAPGVFAVTDRGEFKQPVTFETAVVTFGKWEKLAADRLKISYLGKSLEVRIDTHGAPFTVTSESFDDDIRWREKPERIAIRLDGKVKRPEITLTFTPLP